MRLNEPQIGDPARLSVQLTRIGGPRVVLCCHRVQTQAIDYQGRKRCTKRSFQALSTLLLFSRSVPPRIAYSRLCTQQRTAGHPKSRPRTTRSYQHFPTISRLSLLPVRSKSSVARKRRNQRQYPTEENYAEAMTARIHKGEAYSSLHLRMLIGIVPTRLLIPRCTHEPGG